MSLLALEAVTKRLRRGRRERVVLRDVSLRIEVGELVSVWGVPGSGRTTLLRVAAGLESPDAGVVRFDGRDLAASRELGAQEGIGFAQTDVPAVPGQAIIDYVAMPLLARGVAPAEASEHAAAVLARAGVAGCARLRSTDLDATELVRVAIAQALVTSPRLLVVDEPTRNVDVLERAGVLALMRSIADGGVAVLMTTGEAIGVAGVDRVLTIGSGELRAEVTTAMAPVLSLPGSGTAIGSDTLARGS